MGTYYNDAKCDIYIGKGAGKKLLKDIFDAKKNVKIITPYLSPSLVRELIFLYGKGINIQLVTMDNIEDNDGRNIKELIIQNRITDKNAESIRNKLLKLSGVFSYFSIVLAIIIFLSVHFFNNNKFLYLMLLVLILLLFCGYYKSKARKKRVFSYYYRQLFPFKVYKSKSENNYKSTFIHAKVYIIDDEIAYMGSLNFTISGTKYSYETRIRITESGVVKRIVLEFSDLLNNTELPERDIQLWRSQIYSEPIN